MSTRTLTIPEVAERLSISEKAVRRRIERETLPSLRGHDGRVRVPLSALDAGQAGKPVGQMPHAAGNGASNSVVDISPLVARLEVLAAENGQLRRLTEQAESLKEQHDQELNVIRAENRELRAKLEDFEEVRTKLTVLEAEPPRRRWWRRS